MSIRRDEGQRRSTCVKCPKCLNNYYIVTYVKSKSEHYKLCVARYYQGPCLTCERNWVPALTGTEETKRVVTDLIADTLQECSKGHDTYDATVGLERVSDLELAKRAPRDGRAWWQRVSDTTIEEPDEFEQRANQLGIK